MARSSPDITYVPREGATPETELSALADAYRFVLEVSRKKEAAGLRQADDFQDARKDTSDAGTQPHFT